MPASPAAARSSVASGRVTRARRGAVRVWRRLRFEQRVAVAGALLLAISTLGPFSFVEAAEILIAFGVIGLLSARAEGRRFQLPVRDGTVVLAAGAWAGLLIAVRLLDRPLGQNLLALGCAAILVVAGISERSKDPPPDRQRGEPDPPEPEPPTAWLDDDVDETRVSPTRRIPPDRPPPAVADTDTEPLPPPEFEPPAPGGPATSAGRRGAPAGGEAHEEEAEPGAEEVDTGGQEDRLG
jgi:hypothetical protein